MSILQMGENTKRHMTGYDRPNLKFEVRDKKTGKAAELFLNVKNFILEEDNGQHKDETGIIYCRTQKETEEAAMYLNENGISSNFFHASRTPADKRLVQTAWQKKKIKVVVATIAYGMGIDMPTVRYVLHLCLSKSLEGYYQEAGRAGRDGLLAKCVVFFTPGDVRKVRDLISMGTKTRAVVKRECDNLELMANYCIDVSDCRRRHFRDQFGSATGPVFRRCGNMCDNCLGERKVNVGLPTPTETAVAASAALNLSSSSSAAGKGASAPAPAPAPRAMFQKASALPQQQQQPALASRPAVFRTGGGREIMSASGNSITSALARQQQQAGARAGGGGSSLDAQSKRQKVNKSSSSSSSSAASKKAVARAPAAETDENVPAGGGGAMWPLAMDVVDLT
jgi:superfamily II DNA/RNA helicase